ncbi:LysR family transcriptional regulator [Sandarakinorhabdus sp. DWP1-3-1]|uniref:LysR family transcriptional regulator n=1 Tax=Sandarakinorhabdus sp. DWP1-3-1 TaxID=2804627 RepID=UPI003CEF0370
MDLRQLKTFRAVAELGSLSKAADRLRIAQPALSRQIKLLEHDLKTPLFTRHGRGMVPTEAGELLFERTAGLVRRLEQAREDVLAMAGEPIGRVVVGLVPTVSAALAARITRAVVDNHPGIELRLVDAYGGYLIDWLHRGEIDLAVVYGRARTLHLAAEAMRSDAMFAVAAPGQGLERRRSVTLAWLATQPLVLPSAPHGLRALLEARFAVAGLTLSTRVEADSWPALVDVVSAGVGMTVLPHYAVADRVAAGRLLAVPITPRLDRELVLAMPVGDGRSLATRTVADIVRAAVAELG